MKQHFQQNSRSGSGSRRRRRINRATKSPDEEKTAVVQPSPTLCVNEPNDHCANDVPSISSNSFNSTLL